MLTVNRRVTLIMDTVGAFGRQVLLGVAAYVRAQGQWAVAIDSAETLRTALRQRKVDGIIAQSASPEIERILSHVRIPAVNVSNRFRASRVPRVINDDRAIGQMAAEHFLERGFASFGFVGIPGTYFSWLRGASFAATLKTHGYPCLMHGFHMGRQLRPPLAPWLQSLPKPCAVLGADDYAARSIIHEAMAASIHVPEDVAVVGVENDPILCDFAAVPFSSVQSGAETVGYEAARLLDRLMRGEPPPDHPLLIPPRGVITRRSSDLLTINDEAVSTALRFIREHATANIGVSDVVNQSSLSRRMLELRFRRTLKRPVRKEIERVRVEKAALLLASGELPIGRIAAMTGFAEPRTLSLVFRRVMKTTPSAYRRQFRHDMGTSLLPHIGPDA